MWIDLDEYLYKRPDPISWLKSNPFKNKQLQLQLNLLPQFYKVSFINYLTPFWPKIEPLPPPPSTVTPKRPFYPNI